MDRHYGTSDAAVEFVFPRGVRAEADGNALGNHLENAAERIAGSYYSVATGVCSNFAESPETVPDNIREVQPTLFGAVPRVWEKFYAGIMIALKDAMGSTQSIMRDPATGALYGASDPRRPDAATLGY